MVTGSGDLTAQLSGFAASGHLILPGFLPADLVARLTPEVDHWVDSGLRQRSIDAALRPAEVAPPERVELDLEAHGELAVFPPLLDLLSHPALLGPSFVFHYLHSDRRPANGPGKSWHHDYEQRPQRHRDAPMVHALPYPHGLRPSLGPLAVLPGSHRTVAEKDALAHHGTAVLPGERVIGALPAGSTVILHSALFHTRRPPAPGAAAATAARYLIDASYCRTGGEPWPPVKPYWRQVLASGRRRGLGAEHRPGLFDAAPFTEYLP
ncbi:phytanoyl-CoA dioxygenase family protein [Streptomyces ginkgonis]|uniref:phytanoyl-CoA dioxygenase family protein n=1 Tax=Streptomyces ginkgonis TaxID=1812259 RepID=UPI002176AB46|nr:phytanoyl-CoA dioxygenase family protein [Streptomyces ginkgonis]